jgi:hypothetical protein
LALEFNNLKDFEQIEAMQRRQRLDTKTFVLSMVHMSCAIDGFSGASRQRVYPRRSLRYFGSVWRGLV